MNDIINIKRIIATNIYVLRTNKGYSKRKLGILCNIDEKQIRRMEDPDNYEFVPSIPTLIKIANCFEIPFIKLLTPEEENK